jgi:hypothetical protein
LLNKCCLVVRKGCFIELTFDLFIVLTDAL